MRALIPHPVLFQNGNDYKDGRSFSMGVDDSQLTIDENIIVSASFDLKSDYIKRLVERGQAEFCVVIRCPRTYKRNIRKTTTPKIQLKLPLADYADKIEISPFVAAINPIYPFTSNEHNEEFQGITITVPAGAILAVGAGYEFTVDSLQTVSAAICLTTNPSHDDGQYVVDVEDEYINIEMNAATRKKVERRRKTDGGVLYPALYVPALIHAIINLEESSGRKWSKALNKTLEDKNISSDECKNTPYLVAQKLLDNPLNKILEELE